MVAGPHQLDREMNNSQTFGKVPRKVLPLVERMLVPRLCSTNPESRLVTTRSERIWEGCKKVLEKIKMESLVSTLTTTK